MLIANLHNLSLPLRSSCKIQTGSCLFLRNLAMCLLVRLSCHCSVLMPLVDPSFLTPPCFSPGLETGSVVYRIKVRSVSHLYLWHSANLHCVLLRSACSSVVAAHARRIQVMDLRCRGIASHRGECPYRCVLFGFHCLPVDSAQLVVSVCPTSVGSPLLVPSTSRLPSICTYIIHILYINTRVIIKLIKNDPVDLYKKEDQTLLIFFACFVVFLFKL